ncbi:dockerin type I domain-containing protein [Haliscomenobacter hydrossis]|uniref:Dockerin domain-containing protein n=1 Tax=Haliscomenobacter hydrossis (strain ATCC 27775 / DSM 1100 / LMG 10767 / O) TaxID=760192 RepID=F4KVP6_HALH1|nr:dockerin type I domain-containing protein [Haliscomenobacter hydrossis]AEE52503.1 hypothetical protein Halhy_4668 [Haliscomenobacter hydrossis DSM 1100]
MKNYYFLAILAVVFSSFLVPLVAQTGYIRFIENSENTIRSAHYNTAVPVETLVQSDLAKLYIRRLVEPHHEAIYVQRGYDRNQDGQLNQLDGFELIAEEKFSPWGYQMELMPCGEKESMYIEVRAMQQDSTPVYLQKMLTPGDRYVPWPKCVAPFKVYVSAAQDKVLIRAKDLIQGRLYDDCLPSGAARDTTISPLIEKFSVTPWYIEQANRRPDSSQHSIQLSCAQKHAPTLLSVFAWDASGNYQRCVTQVEIIDTLGICPPYSGLSINDSLELKLIQSFSQLRPLVPAGQLAEPHDSLQHFKTFQVRRSIRKTNLTAWLTLGYDRNQDGQLDENDGMDVNEDGDIADEGEFFQHDGEFVISPLMDSLPLFCTDFGDSLYLELWALDTNGKRTIAKRWLELYAPGYFVSYKIGVSTELKLNPNASSDDERGMSFVVVQDFLTSPFYTCQDGITEPDEWGRQLLMTSIGRYGQVADSNIDTVTLDCCDNAAGYALLNIYAWNKTTKFTHAALVTYAEAYDYKNFCGPYPCGKKSSRQSIFGHVKSQTGSLMAGVNLRMEATGIAPISQNTQVGQTKFSFFEPRGSISSYRHVIPSKNDDILNGVSTLDLIQIQKHILNIKPFHSPYQYIAADINRSGSVTTLDMIQLRKVILNIEPKFVNNSSWRFLDENHIFQNPADPLKEYLPESIRVAYLGNPRHIGFIGIKIGDVNNSATIK